MVDEFVPLTEDDIRAFGHKMGADEWAPSPSILDIAFQAMKQAADVHQIYSDPVGCACGERLPTAEAVEHHIKWSELLYILTAFEKYRKDQYTLEADEDDPLYPNTPESPMSKHAGYWGGASGGIIPGPAPSAYVPGPMISLPTVTAKRGGMTYSAASSADSGILYVPKEIAESGSFKSTCPHTFTGLDGHCEACGTDTTGLF